MANTKEKFLSDTTSYKKRSDLCSKAQLTMMGLAIMLFLMDQSKLYFLIPCALIMAVGYYLQRTSDSLKDEYDGADLEFSPNTILVRKPSIEKEIRIRYQDISRIELLTRHGFKGFELSLADGTSEQLFGFEDQVTDLLKQRTVEGKPE